MIKTASIYLIVKDFEKSVEFYKQLFEQDVIAQNQTRFAIFLVNGFCLSIMSSSFDAENPDKVTTKGKYYEEYDNMVRIAQMPNPGKVVINLETDNLKSEHGRIAQLGIGTTLTEIRYVNAKNPYYYFCLQDPDDNTIEITGPYGESVEGEL